MRNNNLLNTILSRLIEIQKRWKSEKIYVFGSVLDNESNPCDIDILIVLSSHTVPEQLRYDLKNSNEIHPVHITFMTINEEKQFNFVKEQFAVSIWNLAQQV